MIQDVFYVPEFVNREEEAQLLQAVDAAPASRWTHAGERQMQNWGGRPGEAVIREVISNLLKMIEGKHAKTCHISQALMIHHAFHDQHTHIHVQLVCLFCK